MSTSTAAYSALPGSGSSSLPSSLHHGHGPGAISSIFPWSTFLGLFDLKQGSSVISLFALFNKIAGVYGILAVFSGGTFAQVSLYLYSIASIIALLWGLRGISDEDPRVVLRYAHFFTFDHLMSSLWTFFFAYKTFNAPHDGERPPLAPHQQGLMELIEHLEAEYEIPGKVLHHAPLEGAARVTGAQRVWNFEKGFAATVLLAGWALKIFFALTLYSYALHLRHGTYASLPLAKSSTANLLATQSRSRSQLLEDDELDGPTLPSSTRRRQQQSSDATVFDEDDYTSTSHHQQQSSYETAPDLQGQAIRGSSSRTSRPYTPPIVTSPAPPRSPSPRFANGSSAAGDGETGATGSKLGRPDQMPGLERRISSGPPAPGSPISPGQSFFRRDLR